MTITFKPKNIVIEAFQFGIDEMPSWFFANADKIKIKLSGQACEIKNSHGFPETCNHGDYILRSLSGEIFSCSQKTFKKIFEAVER